jgi:hypothetical protein
MSNYDNLQVTLNNIDNIHNEYCKNLVLLKQDLDSNIIEIQALYDYIKTYKRIWNVTYNPIEYPCELPKHFIKEYHEHCNYVEKLQVIYTNSLKFYKKRHPLYLKERQDIVNRLVIESGGFYCTEVI